MEGKSSGILMVGFLEWKRGMEKMRAILSSALEPLAVVEGQLEDCVSGGKIWVGFWRGKWQYWEMEGMSSFWKGDWQKDGDGEMEYGQKDNG